PRRGTPATDDQRVRQWRLSPVAQPGRGAALPVHRGRNQLAGGQRELHRRGLRRLVGGALAATGWELHERSIAAKAPPTKAKSGKAEAAPTCRRRFSGDRVEAARKSIAAKAPPTKAKSGKAEAAPDCRRRFSGERVGAARKKHRG